MTKPIPVSYNVSYRGRWQLNGVEIMERSLTLAQAGDPIYRNAVWAVVRSKYERTYPGTQVPRAVDFDDLVFEMVIYPVPVRHRARAVPAATPRSSVTSSISDEVGPGGCGCECGGCETHFHCSKIDQGCRK